MAIILAIGTTIPQNRCHQSEISRQPLPAGLLPAGCNVSRETLRVCHLLFGPSRVQGPFSPYVSRETHSYGASVWRRAVRLVIILCENLEKSGKALLAVLFCLAFGQISCGQKRSARLNSEGTREWRKRGKSCR